ncbi:phage tail protein [Fusobacterium necrophorum]|uniref:phage tail protein n=1 Tax=Fusobacterium necrophorum TaxID=859 RepID=UPI00254D7C6F|nr:phage tail protein [Fusobacterium necrophorum]MDK4485004.1 phage tail protein [Fusobacterium necrophorum]
MLIGSLGNYIFAASSLYTKTFHSFSKETSVRWIEHKIMHEKPKLQFDGIELSQIKFTIHLNRFFNVNIEEEKKILEKYMIEGKVLRLILGGRKIGNYVITRISEDPKGYSAFGSTTKIELGIELKEYN